MSEFLDLDKGECQIADGTIIDDIRYPCTQLNIIFDSDRFVAFDADLENYFIYKNIRWLPITYSVYQNNNGLWRYDVMAHPIQIFAYINRPYENTYQLATQMGLSLLEGYQSIRLEYCLINMYAGQLIGELINHSFHKAYSNHNIGEALFIYFNSEKLLCTQYRTIINDKARSLQDTDLMQGQNVIKHYDERVYNIATSSKPYERMKRDDFLKKILGKKIEIRTVNPAVFMNTYTMSFSGNNAFDTNVPYLCIRSEQKITESFGFKNYFSEVNYVE